MYSYLTVVFFLIFKIFFHFIEKIDAFDRYNQMYIQCSKLSEEERRKDIVVYGLQQKFCRRISIFLCKSDYTKKKKQTKQHHMI